MNARREPGRLHWVLNEDHTCRAVEFMEWALWFEKANRRVAYTEFVDGSHLSTVFLGLDMALRASAPLLFETMLFYGEGSRPEGFGKFDDGLCQRYATWVEAEDGHRAIVEQLTASFISPTLLCALPVPTGDA